MQCNNFGAFPKDLKNMGTADVVAQTYPYLWDIPL